MQQPLTTTRTTPKIRATVLHLWHLLSLDAPTVAALWTWFIAASVHLRLGWVPLLSMASAVWLLYVADRLLDARQLASDPLQRHGLEARHLFHHRHHTAFLIGVALISIALAALLPHNSPDAMRLYLILGGLLIGYFILIHATGSADDPQGLAHRLPKEIAVGIFFSAAVFIPTVARQPSLRLPLLPAAILFAALCSLNCLFIYAWEHANHDRTHAITRIALRNLSPLTTLLILSATALSLLDRHAPWRIPCSIALSATLLLLLHRNRHGITRITLRATADLALLTPLLLLGNLGHQ